MSKTMHRNDQRCEDRDLVKIGRIEWRRHLRKAKVNRNEMGTKLRPMSFATGFEHQEIADRQRLGR